MSDTTLLTSARPQVAGAVLAPALFAIVFGSLLIFGIGFAGADHLHNAAHDGRHAFAFPCH